MTKPPNDIVENKRGEIVNPAPIQSLREPASTLRMRQYNGAVVRKCLSMESGVKVIEKD
jgi:hypothetical protein